jgi:hypothetical protein
VLGAYPLDIDNDRHTDLVLLRLGRNLVLKGGPDCRFEKANRNFSIDGGRAWSTGMSAIWEKGKPLSDHSDRQLCRSLGTGNPLVPASPTSCFDHAPVTFPIIRMP